MGQLRSSLVAFTLRQPGVHAILDKAFNRALNPPMHTRGDMAKALNRSPVYLHGLQARFDLPVREGAGYSDAYLAFLRGVVFLRMLNTSEESLLDLWHLEKKLLQLLHVDSTGSPTWFLDACGQKRHPRRRLLLTHYDLGVVVPAGTLQLGLNFAAGLPELFAGQEMGEDALRVLGDYLKLHARIRADVAAEALLLRSALTWSRRLKDGGRPRTPNAFARPRSGCRTEDRGREGAAV